MKVSVRLDDSEVKAAIQRLKGPQFKAAVRRAAVRAGNSGRVEMAREIAADTGLPVRRVKDEIRVNRVGEVGVQLEVRGSRIPLIQFGARGPEPSRGRGRGVSYRLRGGRNRVSNAFIATMPSGHRGVFARSPRARSARAARGWTSLPIVQLFGPSLVRVFEKFLPAGAKRAQEALVKNLRSEISFALSKVR